MLALYARTGRRAEQPRECPPLYNVLLGNSPPLGVGRRGVLSSGGGGGGAERRAPCLPKCQAQPELAEHNAGCPAEPCPGCRMTVGPRGPLVANGGLTVTVVISLTVQPLTVTLVVRLTVA